MSAMTVKATGFAAGGILPSAEWEPVETGVYPAFRVAISVIPREAKVYYANTDLCM
jgi:hypothetical protein